MEISTNKHRRSYAGCSRCRSRRQKCDEGKPCGRCLKAHTACEYSINLRWGGRTFDRSRFGDCLKAGARKHAGDRQHGFVYTAHSSSQDVLSPQLSMFQSLPTLSKLERDLLFHFTSEASRITCCSPHVQHELCALIVPMAMESPALMNATLAWASLHIVAYRGTIPGSTLLESTQTIAKLKARSIEGLRRELQAPVSTNSVLATIRTLCQCEIHSGCDQISTWRVHIKGAKALMKTMGQSQTPSSTHLRLLYRWYASLDSLALLSPAGTATSDNERHEIVEESESVYLDDYNGYSTDLSHLLGRIGHAISSQKEQGLTQNDNISSEADSFEATVCHIMERDNSATPVFYPGVREKLNPQAIQEYAWCNQAYQHTTLIYIRRRLRKLPSHTPAIQDSVKTIIDCVRSIKPAYGLSPAIVLTTPLFVAGCEAQGEDRIAVKELLIQLHESLKIRNIKLTLDILENYWGNCGPDEDIEMVLRRQKWDFIPY